VVDTPWIPRRFSEMKRRRLEWVGRWVWRERRVSHRTCGSTDACLRMLAVMMPSMERVRCPSTTKHTSAGISRGASRLPPTSTHGTKSYCSPHTPHTHPTHLQHPTTWRLVDPACTNDMRKPTGLVRAGGVGSHLQRFVLLREVIRDGCLAPLVVEHVLVGGRVHEPTHLVRALVRQVGRVHLEPLRHLVQLANLHPPRQ
jgi:hypothetical protein